MGSSSRFGKVALLLGSVQHNARSHARMMTANPHMRLAILGELRAEEDSCG
jgi:hypothetical protein